MSFGKSLRGLVGATVAISGVILGLASTASAATYTWDPGLTGMNAGGSGTWSTATTSWYTGSGEGPWVTGNDAFFGGTSGTVSISSGTVSANNLWFNASGYSVSGTGTLTLTGGSISVVPGAIATINPTLSLGGSASSTNLTMLGGGTASLTAKLTPSASGTINIGAGTLVLAQPSTAINFNNGGVINGNLVVSAVGERVNFNSLVGSTGSASTSVAVFSGSGAIQLQAPTQILSNTSGTFGGAIGAPGGALKIQLNSLNLPFTAFDVTHSVPAYPATNSFATAIGATKNGSFNGYLQINAPISGPSDVVFTSNSTAGGGAGITLLNVPCTYTGTTLIEGNGGVTAGYTGGSLILGCSNALPSGTDVEFGDINGKPSNTPTIDVNGFNQQIGSLSSNAASLTYAATRSFYIANNSVGSLATLTVSGATTPYNAYGGYLVDHSNITGGTLTLVKNGVNTLNLSGSNTFSGGTTISGGDIQVSNLTTSSTASALGIGSVTIGSSGALAGSSVGGGVTGAVTVQSGGELLPGGVNTAGKPLTLLNNLSLQSGSIVSFVYGALTSTTSAQIAVGGALNFSGTSTVTVDMIPQKSLSEITPLFSFGSMTNGTASISALVLGNSASLPPGFTFAIDSSLGTLGTGNANLIDLVNTSIGNPVTVNWNGTASSNWNTITSNTDWKTSGGSSTYYQDNYSANFSDLSGSGSSAATVNIDAGGVKPGSVTISNSNTAYTFTGGPITGYTSLTSGSGKVTLASSNSYTGGTYVTGGTLVPGAGDLSLGGSVGGLFLDNGATLLTTTAFNTNRNVSIGTSTSSSTSGIFNTNGLNSALNGIVTVGNTNLAGTFTKAGAGVLTLGGATTLTDAAGQTGAVLSVQGGTMQVTGLLNMGNYGSLNIAPSGTLTLATSGNPEINQPNGGVYNGNLVIASSMRLDFSSQTFSGTGQIQVQPATGVILTNASGLTNPSIAGTINPNIVLNSLGLPFTKTDVTQSSISTSGSNSFIVSIGGTKGASAPLALVINGVISGNSDVNFSNSSTGGGSGNVTLNGSSTYTGATMVNYTGNTTGGANGGVVTIGVNNALPINTDVVFGTLSGSGGTGTAGGWIDLNGQNQQIGSLSTGQNGTAANYTITNQTFSLSTLTISGTTTPARPFAGTLGRNGDEISVNKAGSNTLILSNSNNRYNGPTTVSGGMLLVDSVAVGNTNTGAGIGDVTVSGGTFGGVGGVDDASDTPFGTPTVSVSGGATLIVGVPASGSTPQTSGTLSINSNLSFAANSAIAYDFGTGTASFLSQNGGGGTALFLPTSGSVAINLANINGVTGTVPLLNYFSLAQGSTTAFALGNQPSGDTYSLSGSGSNQIDLTITPGTIATASLSGGTTSWGVVLATTSSTSTTITTAMSTSSTLTLDGNQSVGSLAFNAPNGQIVIAKGKSGNLTLGTSSAAPTIQVNSGDADITSSTHIAGNLTVTMSSGTTLELGNVHEDTTGSSLTLLGNGQLSLVGSGSYTGGTVVESGTLIVGSKLGLLDGTNLTIGLPSDFSPSPTIPNEVAEAGGVRIGAVPEPNTLILLAAGAAFCGWRVARRQRTRAT